MRLWPAPAVGSAVVPVFPGYVFAQLCLPMHYRAAASAPGMKGFLHLDKDTPAVVPPEVIEGIKRREGADGLLTCDDDSDPGTRLKIGRGAFKDLYGVLQSRLTGRDRVVLLVNLLQRQIRVEIPGAWLTKA